MDRRELASFLRARRARVRPEDAGLPAGSGRRTPGLRRQEVAQLAGISVDYYIRLEQARGPHPSTQVLEALARALRLADGERAHLFHLAGSAPRPAAGPRTDVPAGVVELLDRLDDAPAIVVDATQQVLAWNPMWAAMMCVDPGSLPPAERNVLRMLFAAEDVVACTDPLGPAAVADLRAAAGRYPTAPEIRSLIADLSDRSTLFRVLWAHGEVEAHHTVRKRICHPLVGDLDLDCQALAIPDRDQRLLIFTAAPGSRSQEALQLLKVVGLQDLHSAR